MGISRRGLLGGTTAFTGGALMSAVADTAEEAFHGRYPLPLDGYAPATHIDRRTTPKHAHAVVRWSVDTTRKVAALTFDDGPRPRWTPEVLDILEQRRAAATFYLVGERVREHGALLRGRLGRHEVANHSWNHRDVARFNFAEAFEDLSKAHAAITEVCGRAPALFRPPYGHMGGGALLAAGELGYDVTLWSVQMLESEFAGNPDGLVEHITTQTVPGSIILAHDVGPEDRLVAIRNLGRMIDGLRADGFELVTVSDLIAAG
jgi:peptidoglycan/xylan/chitin deacetylase (PgdA/CDA1 family)